MFHQCNDPLLHSRDTDSTTLKGIINMDLLRRRTHMFHPPPPPPPPLPPGDKQLHSPFSEKHWNSRIFIYLHSLSGAAGELAAGFIFLHRPPTVWAGVHALCVCRVHEVTFAAMTDRRSFRKSFIFINKYFLDDIKNTTSFLFNSYLVNIHNNSSTALLPSWCVCSQGECLEKSTLIWKLKGSLFHRMILASCVDLVFVRIDRIAPGV